MINFKNNLLAEKFLDDICKSYEIGEKRNLIKDSKKLLQISKIKFTFSHKQPKLNNSPTIIISNHYKRPLYERKSLLTTVDSMITSAIITACLSKITQRKTSWVIKDNLVKNILFYNFKARLVQMAVIQNYDSVGVSTYPFSRKNKWLERLKSGHNIALYPEGVISTKLRQPQKGFATILSFLKENNIKVKILPVGIYSEDGIFKVNFGKDFYPVNLKYAEQEAMIEIAQNLPYNLRGVYSGLSSKEPAKFPARLQLEGDQIPVLVEP